MWILSWPTMPEIEEMLTIEPPPARCMAGTACFMPRKTPRAFTPRSVSQADVLSVSGSNVPLIPALFTRTSSLPKLATAVLTASCHSASRVTSSLTKRACPPALAILSTTWRPSVSRRSPTTTFAPSRPKIIASLWPMPLAPPVMSATLPASRIPRLLSLRGQAEERCHSRRAEHRPHLLVGGAALEAARGVEDLRQKRQVARRVEEHAGHADGPVHRPVDVRLFLERLVPRGVGAVGRGPRPARDGLDDLDRDVALAADREHLLEAPPVALVLRHEEVVRQQHRVEVEAREAPAVRGGDGPAVARHADEPREALRARLDRRLERAAGPQRLVPVVRVAERVELDQVHVVHAEPVERAVDVLARLAGAAAPGLGREEEVLPVARHPRADAQLRVAVARGGVDVVDAIAEQELQRAVGVGLARAGQRRAAEQGDRARVAGPSERSSLEHGAPSAVTAYRIWPLT